MPYLNIALGIVNLANYLLGVAWPVVTFVASVQWASTGVLYRALLLCSVAEFTTVIAKLISDIANALDAFFSAVSNFVNDQGGLLTNELELQPFFTDLGIIMGDFDVIFNCACSYVRYILFFARLTAHP